MYYYYFYNRYTNDSYTVESSLVKQLVIQTWIFDIIDVVVRREYEHRSYVDRYEKIYKI